VGNAALPDKVERTEEAPMNTLDMQTKEKMNTIHLAEMQQDARNRYLVRDLKSPGIPAISSVRIRLVLMIVALVLLVGLLTAIF
jgi:hypothetical protein